MLSLTADPKLLAQARQSKDELVRKLFGASAQATAGGPPVPEKQNIVGVGYGAKETVGAAVEGELAVRVYVRSKLPSSALLPGQAVPALVNGMPTDVVPVGDVTSFPRPTDCGVSVGHASITAGTLGCLVQKTSVSSGEHFILSNNHVLANCNVCAVGDDILEPGPSDGGVTAIAKLSEWKDIQVGGPTNDMDAAIAKVIKTTDVNPDILTIGRVAHPDMLPSLYQSVRKHGERTTLHTVGVIMDVSADLWVGYGTQRAWFENQIAVKGVGGSFSAGGDSGSLIVDAVFRRPVALLFAGGIDLTFGNPIAPVLAHFNVQIL